ncbi:hypothetical protein FA15DRAFT_757037 [Coprinopsis marcescibilis]|uniref:G-protein coupled receptors family 1 profile domain-containing protein n=1 Tax=Coprinopsis marcescibilis TaxID=230819 RepID=A0A5C3KT45_COPMA|nr:hypothetical protein FA15DRAFT_757037 [Coprinopsis marcescibilis]
MEVYEDSELMGYFLAITQANSAVGIASTSMQIFMCVYGLSIYLETPRVERQGRLPYLITSFVLLATCLLSTVANCWTAFKILILASPDGQDVRPAIAQIYISAGPIIASVGFWIVILICDALLIYRTYIIWIDKAWVVILPAIAHLSTIALMVRSFIPITSLYDGQDAPYLSALAFLKLGINISTTSLISYRLLRMRSSLKKNFPTVDSRVYLGVVAILVESALPVVIFGLMYAITITLKGKAAYKVYGFSAIAYNFFVEMSPQWIIFRVATGRSWVRTPPAMRDETTATRPIMFANANCQSSIPLASEMHVELGISPRRTIKSIYNSDITL